MNNLLSLIEINIFKIVFKIALLCVIGFPTAFILSRFLGSWIGKKFKPQWGMIANKIVLYSGVCLIGLLVLNHLGLDIGPLLGAAGIVGIALGFASQTSVSNIISGLFLIAENSFEVDDIVKIGETCGIVQSIDILSVKIRTFDNKFVRIPNEAILKNEVTNFTHYPIRRIDLTFGVGFTEDLDRVRTLLLDIAAVNSLILCDPEPMVLFNRIYTSSIDVLFGVWILPDDFLKAKNSIIEGIMTTFKNKGIEIPFPQITLHPGTTTNAFERAQ